MKTGQPIVWFTFCSRCGIYIEYEQCDIKKGFILGDYIICECCDKKHRIAPLSFRNKK